MATLSAKDVDPVFAALDAAADVTILSEPAAIAAPPYNGARSFAALGPDGERLEICETMWA